MRANQIIVLDKGAAVERGTHEELLQHPDGYYARQAKEQMHDTKDEEDRQRAS